MTRTATLPASRRRVPALTATFLGLVILATIFPPTVAAAPSQLWEKCQTGQGAGQCSIPRGIAADPVSGHLYVADQGNQRINEFTAWGEFVRAWGWDVVESGPGNDTEVPIDEFEVCVFADGDVCKAGLRGGGPGQFNVPVGVAVDSSGDVYIVDQANRRVQKFDTSAGPGGQDVEFLLMFGGGVNQGPTNPGNVCTVAHIEAGDVCVAGTEGGANGQFGRWPFVAAGAGYIAVNSDDEIVVGDEGRIQSFDTKGVYEGEIALPGETVSSLAINRLSGNIYVAFVEESTTGFPSQTKPNVHELSAGGAELGTIIVDSPTTLTTDPVGNLYVVDGVKAGEGGQPIIRKFSPAGVLIEAFTDGFDGSVGNAIGGLATNTVTQAGGIDLYASNSVQQNSYVRAYGPPPDKWLPPQAAPTIADSYAISADAHGATVRAAINPHFWADARYYVEYGLADCASNPCTSRPAPPGSLLTANTVDAELQTAGIFLGDLHPDTTYHYRFVADSGGGGPVFGPDRTFRTFPRRPEPNTGCPNQAFRTGAAAHLPDCRAYEMVSPVDKNNGDVATGAASFARVASGGDRMTFSSYTAFANPASAPYTSQYIAERDAEEGWSTRSISAPRESVSFYLPGSAGSTIPFKAFTEDLCSGWVLQDTDLALAPGAPPGVPNLYRRQNCGTADYELLTTAPPPGFSLSAESSYYPQIQGFSADGGRSVFRAPDALTPNASPESKVFQVYVAYDGGKLRLVSVLPNGSPATTHASAGTAQGFAGGFREASVHHAVSEDASRIFWTRGANAVSIDHGGGEGDIPGQLYVRMNATEPQSLLSGGECSQPLRACTIEISDDGSARFWAANPEGTKAIYSAGETLFEFDVEEEVSEPIAVGLVGFMGASEDASHVYFASSEVLTGEALNSEGDEAQDGMPNLYLYEKGSGFAFVGTLSSVDIAQHESSLTSSRSPVATAPFNRTSRVSPAGRYAAFTSTAPLTGYDNTDARSGEPDGEVYRYDASADGGEGQLICVSCNPSGVRPAGRTVGPCPQDSCKWFAALLPGWRSQTHPGNALSDDGKRLFFESSDALVLADTNGKQDVYQWEAPGSGDCTEDSRSYFEGNGGCLSLISSGESPDDSEFFDATADGSDVFFATNSSLLPQDPGLADVYNAKEGGGFPPPPPPPPACVGDACQSVPAPPNDPTPASAGFIGAGDPKARRDCGSTARRATKLARKAKRARRAVKRISAPRRSKRMGRRSARIARNAKRLRKVAKRCRARNRTHADRGGSR